VRVEAFILRYTLYVEESVKSVSFNRRNNLAKPDRSGFPVSRGFLFFSPSLPPSLSLSLSLSLFSLFFLFFFYVPFLFARENTIRVPLPVTRFAFFDSSQQRSLIGHCGYAWRGPGWRPWASTNVCAKKQRINRGTNLSVCFENRGRASACAR